MLTRQASRTPLANVAMETHQVNMPQFQLNFSSNMLVALVKPLGLGQDKFCLFDYRRCSLSLFNSWRKNIFGIIKLLFSSRSIKSK